MMPHSQQEAKVRELGNMSLPVRCDPKRLVVTEEAAVCKQHFDQGAPDRDATLCAPLSDQRETSAPPNFDVKLDRLESASAPMGAISSESTDSSEGTGSGCDNCKADSSGMCMAHAAKGSAEWQREVMLRLAYIGDSETKVRIILLHMSNLHGYMCSRASVAHVCSADLIFASFTTALAGASYSTSAAVFVCILWCNSHRPTCCHSQ